MNRLITVFFLIPIVLFSQVEIKTFYNENDTTKINEIFYVVSKTNMIKNGIYLKYYQNGVLKVKGFYKQNKKDSIWFDFFENGMKLSKIEYENDLKNGIYVKYFENIIDSGYYKQGKKDSLWYKYNLKGTLNSFGYYKNDKKNGIWKYYDNGYIERTETFLDNIKQGECLILTIKGDTLAKGIYNKNSTDKDLWTFYKKDKFDFIAETQDTLKIIEDKQHYRGGLKELSFYISNEMQKYDLSFLKEHYKVYVKFTVKSFGEISNIKIIHSIPNNVPNEIKEILKKVFLNMPSWIPGYQNGILVDVDMVLPVKI